MRSSTKADLVLKQVLGKDSLDQALVDLSLAKEAGEVLQSEGYHFEWTCEDGRHVFVNQDTGMIVELNDDYAGGFKWTFSDGSRGVSVSTLKSVLGEGSVIKLPKQQNFFCATCDNVTKHKEVRQSTSDKVNHVKYSKYLTPDYQCSRCTTVMNPEEG